jgi:hypothetical protein
MIDSFRKVESGRSTPKFDNTIKGFEEEVGEDLKPYISLYDRKKN